MRDLQSLRARGPAFAIATLLGATSLPASAAHFIGPYPFAVGDSFVFAYTSSDSVQQGSAKPAVTTEAYTQTTTIMPAVSYDFPPGGGSVMAYPYQTTATETTSAGTYTLKLTEYRKILTSYWQSTPVEYGYTQTTDLVRPDNVDEQLNTTRVFGTPYMLDQLPAIPGKQWMLPIGGSQIINDRYLTGSSSSNILQRTRTDGTDGSYKDVGTNVDVPFTLTQLSNGTGTLVDEATNANESWRFGLPTAGSSGDIIPVQVTFQGKIGNNQVPDWFPGHAAPRNPLATDVSTDMGLATAPAGCGKYAGKRARLLRFSYTQLGPVEGFTYAETTDYYVAAGLGRVCIVDGYTETDYDSKSTGKVTQTETFSSTASLVSETLK